MNLKDQNYEERKKVAIKAFNGGYVIFAKASKRFYTPREFVNSNEVVVIEKIGLDEYMNCTLINPKHAIGRKLEDLQKAQKEFEQFIESMMSAFDLHPLKGIRK
jgi:hypothetical protein